MAKYEMLYLLNNDLSDEAKDAKIAKFENIVTSMAAALLVRTSGVRKKPLTLSSLRTKLITFL